MIFPDSPQQTLLTGDGSYTDVTSVACYLFDLLKQQNDEGTYYPLLGIGFGMQLMLMCLEQVGGQATSVSFTNSYSQKLEFTNEATNAALYDSFIGGCITNFQKTTPVHYFKHTDVIYSSRYAEGSDFYNNWEVLAHAYNSGTKFIAAMEGKYFPFYGTEFNLELKVYEVTVDNPSNENTSDLESSTDSVSRYLLHYFVLEASRNNFSFTSDAARAPYLIENAYTLKTVSGWPYEAYFPS
mmetsp:Transcript_16477/g.29723  ORF Transcript_16477/g.29723 Transcript_16477/m.29723 type:complete len:240 (-) Transcript_16477:67-786(-)